MKKILLLNLFLLWGYTLFASGGGVYYGNYNYNSRFSNIDMSKMYYYGGYGYGSDYDGNRNGGFGLVIFSEDPSDNIYQGAFGGFIRGKEATFGPLMFSANIWTGVGHTWQGVSLIADINGEIGFAVFPWMQVAVYGGMQGTTSFMDIFDTYTYTPVFGARIVWGDFES